MQRYHGHELHYFSHSFVDEEEEDEDFDDEEWED